MKHRSAPIKNMADIASAMKATLSKEKPRTVSALNESTKKASEPKEVDLGLSSYELWKRATEDLVLEKKMPNRIMDFKKIARLEGMINILQQDIRSEVDRYKPMYPELTHAELSKKALAHKAAEQDELIRQEANRKAKEIEANRQAIKRAELDKAKHIAEELKRAEAERKIAAEADRALTVRAKKVIEERSIVRCTYCVEGKREVVCHVCDGDGKIAPHYTRAMRPIVGCCNRPSCERCGGTNVYTAMTDVITTDCTNPKCREGVEFETCVCCKGFQISTKKKTPLPLTILRDAELVKKIQSLLNLRPLWNADALNAGFAGKL